MKKRRVKMTELNPDEHHVISDKIQRARAEWNLLLDTKKLPLDKKIRARAINNILKETGWSQRQLARNIGIPKSTIEDWLLFGKISDNQYQRLKVKGYNDTEIYRKLRGDRSVPVSQKVEEMPVKRKTHFENDDVNVLDDELTEVIYLLRKYTTRTLKGTAQTYSLVKELRNILNKIEMKIEKEMKKVEVMQIG
jgi:DNA-binding transcriptional regulator YiaG